MVNTIFDKKIKYKNLLLVGISIIIAIIIPRIEVIHNFLLSIGNLGYLGAFIAGILFVSSFTVSIGAVLLLILAEQLPAIELGLIAGLGGVVGDLIIFNLIRNKLSKEIYEIYTHVDRRKRLKKLLHTKYFRWSLPILGALIMASPLPDEMGIGLLGITKISKWKFILISYSLNAIGIFLVVSASVVIKP